MATQNHVHKYRRFVYKRTGHVVFFCVLPDCTYKTSAKFTLGKRNICNRCGEEFLMNEVSIRLEKPHCNECTKHKRTSKAKNSAKVEQFPTAAQILSEVGKDVTADLRSRLSSIVKDSASHERLDTANDEADSSDSQDDLL
jgi:late competence protein required for DNA uptake (superfamily II DNA/RNA helicase)